MFWRKKKQVEPPKQIAALQAYLSSSFPLVRGKVSNPHVRVAIQVFVLGMADMLRQAERLDWEQFIAVYSSALSDLALVPDMGAGAFVQAAGQAAQRNEAVQKLMSHGAQSIRMFVAERDADAPTDLIAAALFAEKNSDSLSELAGI